MTRHRKVFAAWLGLLAIALHAFVPVAGLAAYGAPPSSSGHQHAGKAHEAGHDAHAVHAAHHGAQEAPGAPDTFCVGDCPCCTSHYKIVIPARMAAHWALVPLSAVRAPRISAVAGAAFESVYAHPARAPPFSS